MATRAAGGYGLPSTSTLGSHVHHSPSGTPERAFGMCLPQPRHDFLAVTGEGRRGANCQREIRRTLIKYGNDCKAYSTLGMWLRNTSCQVGSGVL